MSRPIVESSGSLRLPRWRRLSTLGAEQALISASPYAITWTFVRTAPVEALPGFYICWLWSWGLFAVLSELVLTPARVLRADRALPDEVLSDVVLCGCLGSTVVLGIAAVASSLEARPIASVSMVVSLALAALAFFTRRLQADENPLGMLPRAVGYFVLVAAGSHALARVGIFTQLAAIACTCIALMTAAAWGNSSRPVRSATTAALLLRQVWPHGRWYAVGTVMRMVLHSAGLVTFIRVQRGAEETSVVAAMSVLVAPLSIVGSVLPWAHLPELRSALGDRAAFMRIWLQQLGLYLGILGVASVGLTVVWESWVHLSVADTGLAAAVSSERPVVLILLAVVVLNSWTGAALIAMEKVKSPLLILSVSGVLAMCSVPLGAPAAVSVTLPYAFALALGIGVVLAAARSLGGRSR